MENKFDFNQAKLEEISCNLCGGDNFFVLAKKTGSGLKMQTCICKDCGLIFINPRMSGKDYDNYYKYFYHQDRASQKGKTIGEEAWQINFEKAKKFGIALAKRLAPYIGKKGIFLDVGSSTGGILSGLKESFPEIGIMGIEPSPKENEFANALGIKTFNTLFENWQNKESILFSTIFCVQSLNHLLDPKKFLLWSFDNLSEGGCLVLAVKNFRDQCRRAGSISAGVQVDHPFMFAPEVLNLFVESTGFEIIHFDVDEYKSKAEIKKQKEEGLHSHHIRIVAKKINKKDTDVKNRGKNIYRKLRWQLSYPILKARHYLGIF